MNYLSLWVSLYFLHILCIEDAIIKLTNCCISISMLSAMLAGDTSQITHVQIMCKSHRLLYVSYMVG